MKNLKLFVVLFVVDEFDNARKMAEDIENNIYEVEKKSPDDIVMAYDIREAIATELSLPEEKKEFVEVYPITDFMDAYNNEECNEAGTFMSYVSGKIKGS